jgi:hypothetical integral membrane protein (TIGR02206 family)
MREEFSIGSPSHILMVILFLAGCGVIVKTKKNFSHRNNRIFALAILSLTVPLQLLQFTQLERNINTSLPFQLCDLAWMVAVFALWTGNKQAATIIYLWGTTLTTQAMLTPELHSPWPEPRFIMFWIMHFLVAWTALYVVVGVGLRPTWKSYRNTIFITLGWMVSVFIFNSFMGTNYGYVNGKPKDGSILDLLGPWPFYLLVEIFVVALVWAGLTLLAKERNIQKITGAIP